MISASPTLSPRELYRVASELADIAARARVDVRAVLAEVGLSPARVNLAGAPAAVWGEIASQLDQGASQEAGYGADAVAALIAALGGQLPGSRRLSELAYSIAGRRDEAGAKPPAGSRRDVFLCYSRKDSGAVDALYQALADRDLRVFQDTKSVAPGQRWLDVIRDNVSAAAVLACWLTPSFLESVYTLYEVGVAEASGARVVPVPATAGVLAGAPVYLTEKQALSVPDPANVPAIADEIVKLFRPR